MKIPFLKNTVTNYLALIIRMVQGILITRWMIRNLGEAQYGLWIMLWSFFSYALLLDLGFGVAAQKAAATELFRRDLEKFNRIISSILFGHVGMALLILPLTLIGMYYVRILFHLPEDVSAETVAFCRQALFLSGLASAIVFPLGVFPEILVGLQKLYLRNYIIIVSKITELAGVIVIFLAGGGIIELLIFVMGIMGVTQLAMYVGVRRNIPGFRIRPVLDREVFRGIFRFSASVYLISIGRMVWERGMFLLLSIFCGLAPVGIFQVGSRIPMLIQQTALPYAENLSPISAFLYSRGRNRNLAQILQESIRRVNFPVAGIMAGVVIFAPCIINVLFHVVSPQADLICRVFALFVAFLLILRQIPEKFLTMVEEHAFLARVQCLESLFFIVISIVGLLLAPNPFVVLGVMAATKAVGTLFFVLPRLIRRSGMEVRHFLCRSLLEPLLPAVATGILFFLEYHFLRGRMSDFRLLVLGGISGVLIYMPLLYQAMLSENERKMFREKLRKINPGRRRL